jgi:hypothetical protein
LALMQTKLLRVEPSRSAWMAGTSPAMTREGFVLSYAPPLRFS